LMAPEVQASDGCRRHGTGGRFADHRQHRAMMVRIAVRVEQCRTRGRPDLIDDEPVAALADVDHGEEARVELRAVCWYHRLHA